MADTFGAETIPLSLPLAGEEISDPGVSRLADFFMAVINANATANWETVMPGALPVSTAFTHNPEEVSFNERDLPALWLNRVGEDPLEWLAEDYDIAHVTMRLLWVFPAARQEVQKDRNTFVNGIAHILAHCIELGRHPAYVLPGDPDPTATTQGSVIMRVAGLWELKWNGYKSGLGLHIKTTSETRNYYCLDAKIGVSERRTFDIVADFPATKGLDLTITTPDKARDLAVGKL
jgi:hypothetical protein